MKLALLGATGQTGQQLLKQALQKDFQVRVIVRNTGAVNIQSDNLEVIKGDVLSPTNLKGHFQGCDVIVSCLGSGNNYTNVTFYSKSIRCIVEAARASSIKRLVTMTAWETKYDPNDHAFEIPESLLDVMADMAEMEDYLFAEAQDLDFVIVRPGWLTNDSITDKEILTHETKNYVPDASIQINRADVARFMLTCIKGDKHLKKAVAIGVK